MFFFFDSWYVFMVIIIIVINSFEKCLKFNVINFIWNIDENKMNIILWWSLEKVYMKKNVIKSLEYF